MIKQAIKDLKTQILLAQVDGNAAFVFTAMLNNQVKDERQGLTYDFPKPAVLIELLSPHKDAGLHWGERMGIRGADCLGQLATVMDIAFRFSIVHEELNAATGGTVNYGMDENLDVFDYRDALKRALLGFQPANCSPLMYDGESPDYDHNNVYVYSISLKTAFVDTKGSYLDVDSGAIYAQPPFNLDLDTYFTTPAGPLSHQAYGWKPCSMAILLVNAPAYASGTDYAAGAVITYNGVIYTSLQNGNTGNEPDTSPAWWTQRTQTLANGDTVPTQYMLNGDGTLTIPELASYPGITVLTPFLRNSNGYGLSRIGYDNTTGTFNFSAYGGFALGDSIEINAVLPIYTA